MKLLHLRIYFLKWFNQLLKNVFKVIMVQYVHMVKQVQEKLIQ